MAPTGLTTSGSTIAPAGDVTIAPAAAATIAPMDDATIAPGAMAVPATTMVPTSAPATARTANASGVVAELAPDQKAVLLEKLRARAAALTPEARARILEKARATGAP
jgi:hypothetical protein